MRGVGMMPLFDSGEDFSDKQVPCPWQRERKEGLWEDQKSENIFSEFYLERNSIHRRSLESRQDCTWIF